MDIKDLKFIKSVDGIEYFLYKPRLGKWYFTGYPGYSKHSIPHKFRMLIEFLEGGYEIFYMYKNGRVLGYILVARGGKTSPVFYKKRYCAWTNLGKF